MIVGAMKTAFNEFLATGILGGLSCGSTSEDVKQKLGQPSSQDLQVSGGVELRKTYGNGAMTLFFERDRVTGIGVYWGSLNTPPEFLRNHRIDTQKRIGLDEFRTSLARMKIAFTEFDDGRVLVCRDSGVLGFTDRSELGSLVKACSGSLFLKSLLLLEPGLNGKV